MSQALADRLATGATYRQLDHWTRCGYLHPEPGGENMRGDGIGYARRWPEYELAIARRMVWLIGHGMTARAASSVARSDGYEAVEDALTPITGLR